MKRNRQSEDLFADYLPSDSDDENAAATSTDPVFLNLGLLRDMGDSDFFHDDSMARRYGMSLNDYRKKRHFIYNLVKDFMSSYAPSKEKKQLIEDYQVFNEGMDPEFLASWDKKLRGTGKINKSTRRKKKGSALDILGKLSKMKTKKSPGMKKVGKKLKEALLDHPIKIEPQSPPLPQPTPQPKSVDPLKQEYPGIPPVEYFLALLDKLEKEGKVPKNPLL